MEWTARIRFTAHQKAELWERWRNGQCVADTRMLGNQITAWQKHPSTARSRRTRLWEFRGITFYLVHGVFGTCSPPVVREKPRNCWIFSMAVPLTWKGSQVRSLSRPPRPGPEPRRICRPCDIWQPWCVRGVPRRRPVAA
jgi:hypothetical protein